MKKLIITMLAALLLLPSFAQKKSAKSAEGYVFTPAVELKTTPVKNQASTGTCWSFATTSFIESELIRMQKGEYDLSEMWIVRHNYVDRMRDNFVQKGNGNLGQGSLAHDWMLEFTENGIVPDEVYTGLNYGVPSHNHSELNSMLNAISKVPVDRRRETDQYLSIIDEILDTYLGELPEKFTYKGVGYTPKSFARSLGIRPEDYIEITSFNYFPFYTQGLVAVPDNWRKVNMYNVPLDEMIAIMDHALNNGYTVNWDGDVSEKGFSHRNGVAIIPEVNKAESYTASEKSWLGNMSAEERTSEAYKFTRPFPEMNVTQDIREEGYNNKTTTDDHLMHITGITKDQNGKKYYITKNSWGPNSNNTGGYLNMSEAYVRAKTIFVMVHKDAIPAEIKAKLKL